MTSATEQTPGTELTLTVVTPTRKLSENISVSDLTIPGADGELNILPGHTPIFAMMKPGILKYREAKSKTENTIAISFGFIEILDDNVSILAETAEPANEIDRDRAKQAKSNAEKNLEQGQDLDPIVVEKFRLKLMRALIRLQASGK